MATEAAARSMASQALQCRESATGIRIGVWFDISHPALLFMAVLILATGAARCSNKSKGSGARIQGPGENGVPMVRRGRPNGDIAEWRRPVSPIAIRFPQTAKRPATQGVTGLSVLVAGTGFEPSPPSFSK
ncbi:MAG: hypothetical protein DHS20C21_01030 [Gemmatimonadota bacterium]|nr:MAG: hypothetical protein DHS20C21_01030 [Gemmatimonadota bacterium]